MTGYHTRSMLCLPIKDSNNEVIGVAQVINKQGDYEATFTAHDSRVFAGYLQFCGIGLKNAQLYERSQLEIKRNQVLYISYKYFPLDFPQSLFDRDWRHDVLSYFGDGLYSFSAKPLLIPVIKESALSCNRP